MTIVLKQRCLVTGGAGFIGSHLAERLQQLGHTVTVLDNYSRGNKLNIDQLNEGITYIEGNILDEQLIGQLVKSHDVVFHLAAILGVKTTVTKPLEMMENNLYGTLNILKHALPQKTKVVFASTSEVYGKGTPPFSEETDRLFGSTSKMRWSYAVEKTFEETLCLGFGLRGLPVTILRYFNVFGPGAKDGPYGGVIPRFIQSALRGTPIEVYGDGTQTRSFTYISDAVEGTIAAMSHEVNQEIINIGNTHETSIASLAAIIKRETNTSSPIVYVPYGDVYPSSFEDIPNRVADLSKAHKLLGYEPKVPFIEGIRLTIKWFQNDLSSRAE